MTRNLEHDTIDSTRTVDTPCPCCGHDRPRVGNACPHCRVRLADWLNDLPGQVARLAACLVPGAAPAGDRVSTSRTGSPTPARLDVLSLIGPGNAEVRVDGRALIPRVRRWATTEVVKSAHDGTEHVVTVWHRQVDRGPDGRPLLYLADDQIGSIPPAEWLAMQVAEWRRALGYSRPARDRDQVGADARWLGRHLDDVADRELVDMARLHAELRTLRNELERVLGETPDTVYLGRCPTLLTARDTGVETPCGMALWHDPHASVITCARCRSAWATQGRGWIDLAVAIRRVWPIDRRRRYSVDEADAAVVSTWAPACREDGCGRPLPITWTDVTEPRDKGPMWRPTIEPCRIGHAEAEVAA
ncbi:hypothetical protein [Catenuloplanes indicus]|uniref:Uncharacterized protein n=1 Tax=Catenuloplanes indicus TaxID=137267 RepID=A0AAE3WAM8_9ACTN|nr:hypothetical protein [Catenuloplanes indicus]MDQ0371587.1 hypothetical protein [Catenuloplanes indicus]